ncbi:dual specificity mitogen-activated protein kinase kinase hemipterous-like [Culicoides brevitarsis]|uniref:dual specificity mitogen-activated protein kinase kinase hemipterous-like n=1 Tax=Culicoides brevitarsis TaxID=469753 RepID=UPI00307C5F13
MQWTCKAITDATFYAKKFLKTAKEKDDLVISDLEPMMSRNKLLKLPIRKTERENAEKFKNIMGRNKILTINGQEWHSEREDMQDQGEIGYGTCGHVQKMIHLPTGTPMAVKQMRRSGNDEENKRIAMDLDVVLKSHDCRYIVRCFGCFIFDSEVWICMELMATCFDRLLRHTDNKAIPERILGKVTVATVKALSYLKDKHGVIHRDVKPSNILIDTLGNIKLCDFGISGRLVDSKAKTRSAGCAAYMSPERIDPKQGNYDIRADVWALGITLIELATGVLPYQDCQTEFEVLAKVLGSSPPRLPADKGFHEDFHRFVNLCLTKDFNDRPKYQQLLQEPFITYYENAPVDVAKWYQSISQCFEANKTEFAPIPTIRPKFSLPPSQILNGNTSSSVTSSGISSGNSNFEIMTRNMSEFKFAPLNRTPNLSARPDRSLSPPSTTKTPPARQRRLGLITPGRNYCICDIKSSVENLQENTSPILIKRYCHQQSQMSVVNGGNKMCPRCNGGRKASSANAAIPANNYSNGFSPLPQRQFSYDSPQHHAPSHIPSRLSREDTVPRHHRSTDTYLNSDSCDTKAASPAVVAPHISSSSSSNASTITNNSSSNSNFATPFQKFFANGALPSSSNATTPSTNGNRVHAMTQLYQQKIEIKTTTTTTMMQEVTSPPPLKPRRLHETPPELPRPRKTTTEAQQQQNGQTNSSISFLQSLINRKNS